MSKKDVSHFNTLLKKIASGNKDALEEFYNVYGKLIYITALTVTKSSFLADEVVDDMLVKIWRYSPKKKIENPKGWLYILSINLAKDKIKKESQLSELCISGQDEFENVSGINDFYSEIKDLSETEQKIMILKFVEDVSFKEMSKILKMPLSSVSSIYYRALKKLEKNLMKLRK